MKRSKIKTILIGLGRICSSLETDPFRKKPCTHMGVLQSDWGKDRFEFILGLDSHSEKCESFQSSWNLPAETVHPDPSKFSLPKSIQLAVISTPSVSHENWAIHCITQGIPNLLIEKPVALTESGAKRIQKHAIKYNTRIWINHERRYHPSYKYVKEQLTKGNLGKLKSIRASVFTSAKNPGLAFSKLGGGPLLHDGTHAVDLLHWILGKSKLVDSRLERPKKGATESRAVAWFRSMEGVDVFLDVSGGRKYFQFELDLHTDSHRIICSNDGFQFFQSQTSKLYKGFQSLSPYDPPDFPSPETANAFLGIYDEIYQVIKGNKQKMEGTLSDNIEILNMIESIYRKKR
ncbi:Gfo/Idh/MocA family oxidoreductase [Leptospira sp. 2 VSF19]|uniref:Gfo/Idh/MocA family oxidoreductase n=1 Tax=Leptospira soteropolitanensis TaxID=2950025 RepID=A0AAW5VAX3_9LEPT|nr:Gfo/Idh/MocA family oxidoreductase [Leptospira soteropolitanensis]MCW7492135.1 Gfo/Idh/MocA family oxidoreductase [Leptospira soteropolitanensis]MCW7499717.1 Gfo/Idh/MocA family oxidoreductase [Leptospira soteropolitanensis]MCW7521968.1 Gfo/Idh/MocA family oxidoreductase [Leptospira soteropolitanensis]MCW7525822.1 Gfo/Idh/MocA family oxidoreductase [Leptospira soteropolitanensis]MCW7530064.1 Gfo/Idh/MocA family oxidoreductase [Leptospira soteropolitanensis]